MRYKSCERRAVEAIERLVALVERTLKEIFAILEPVAHTAFLNRDSRVLIGSRRLVECCTEFSTGIILFT